LGHDLIHITVLLIHRTCTVKLVFNSHQIGFFRKC